MPEVKKTTQEERDAIFASIDYIQDRLKKHPTVSLIAQYSGLPSKHARAVVSKMSREKLLGSDFVGPVEYIYKN